MIGYGGENDAVVNRLKPNHLYTGITLVGKGVKMPAGIRESGGTASSIPTAGRIPFPGKTVDDGESLFPRRMRS